MITIIRALKIKVAPNLVINRAPLDRQINDLRAALQELRAERDELARYKEHVWNTRHMDQMLHHHPHRISGQGGVVTARAVVDDMGLVSRVADAYRKSVRTPVGPKNSVWLNEFASANSRTHETLESSDLNAIASMLRNHRDHPLSLAAGRRHATF